MKQRKRVCHRHCVGPEAPRDDVRACACRSVRDMIQLWSQRPRLTLVCYATDFLWVLAASTMGFFIRSKTSSSEAADEPTIDPTRSFGRPLVAGGGVPTEVVAAAVKAEGSTETVATLYRLPLRGVKDAVLFEDKLAA